MYTVKIEDSKIEQAQHLVGVTAIFMGECAPDFVDWFLAHTNYNYSVYVYSGLNVPM